MRNKKLTIGVSVKDIETLESAVKEYKEWLVGRSEVLLDRLAQLGATDVSLRFARAIYTGKKDVSVSVKKIRNGYKVVADGESVLFIEFGSGITYGGGHPEASEHGMGPGTYPEGKGHWNDPRGWYLPKEKGGTHTYGNPPAMAGYNAVKNLERELPRLVKEVFW